MNVDSAPVKTTRAVRPVLLYDPFPRAKFSLGYKSAISSSVNLLRCNFPLDLGGVFYDIFAILY